MTAIRNPVYVPVAKMLPCAFCNGTGYHTLNKQGDPVPDHPHCFYASTLIAVCECRTFIWGMRDNGDDPEAWERL